MTAPPRGQCSTHASPPASSGIPTGESSSCGIPVLSEWRANNVNDDGDFLLRNAAALPIRVVVGNGSASELSDDSTYLISGTDSSWAVALSSRAHRPPVVRQLPPRGFAARYDDIAACTRTDVVRNRQVSL